MSVHCVYCGTVNEDGSSTCVNCGRALPPAPGGGAAPPSWDSSGQAGQTPSYPPPDAGQTPSWGQPNQNPSYGNQNQGYGGSSYPDPSSYGGTQGSYGNQYPAQQPAYPPANPWDAQGQGYGGAAFASPEANTAKNLAIIGLILGIVGLIPCCGMNILFGIPAVIMGFIAKSKMSKVGSSEGNGMAIGAIILGLFDLAFFVILLIIGVLGNLANL